MPARKPWPRWSAWLRRRRTADSGRRAAGGVSGCTALTLIALGLALTLAALRPIAGAEPGRAYRFGVFPYVSVLTIDRVFGPIAASFSRDLGGRSI